MAISWYNSQDFKNEGFEDTTIGDGEWHTFPKARADVYGAVQSYSVKRTSRAESENEMVYMLGNRITWNY